MTGYLNDLLGVIAFSVGLGVDRARSILKTHPWPPQMWTRRLLIINK